MKRKAAFECHSPTYYNASVGLNIVAAVSKKLLNWLLRREGFSGAVVCFC